MAQGPVDMDSDRPPFGMVGVAGCQRAKTSTSSAVGSPFRVRVLDSPASWWGRWPLEAALWLSGTVADVGRAACPAVCFYTPNVTVPVATTAALGQRQPEVPGRRPGGGSGRTPGPDPGVTESCQCHWASWVFRDSARALACQGWQAMKHCGTGPRSRQPAYPQMQAWCDCLWVRIY